MLRGLTVCIALMHGVMGLFDPIAFTLGQNTMLLNAATGTTVPFPLTITSHNTLGDVRHGVFTCQYAGLYKFQVYSLAETDANVYLELFKNQDLMASLWSHAPNDYGAAGNAVILGLKVGDVMQVKTRSDSANVSLYNSQHQVYSTFSGVQLGSMQFGSGSTDLAAFSGSNNLPQLISGGSPVQYNTTLTDVTGSFNGASGTFTAQTGGLYIFHFFSMARQNHEMWQDLYHNTDYVCSIYGLADHDSNGAGNTVILHLKSGDTVSVTARSGTDNDVYGAADKIFTTFSGNQLVTDRALTSDGHSPVLAFSAGLTRTTTVSANDKVIYDMIFIDLDHAYNHVTGEFLAPVAGLYEFNYHVLGQQDSAIWLELFHNYKYVNSLYSHTPNHYGAAGNSAIIELDAGDVVYVRAHDDSTLYGLAGEIYCTFSGYLLHPQSSGIAVGK